MPISTRVAAFSRGITPAQREDELTRIAAELEAVMSAPTVATFAGEPDDARTAEILRLYPEYKNNPEGAKRAMADALLRSTPTGRAVLEARSKGAK
jgi:hypothetical protein